jgi:hypothetical protein
MTLHQQPAGRLWECEDEDNNANGENQLKSNREPPGYLTTDKGHAKIKPISNRDTDSDKQDFGGNQATTGSRAAKLRLVPLCELAIAIS